MPLTKVRRPKSTRKNIKQELFSVSTSCKRLHEIQQTIEKEGCDALLLIIGIDSRFNKGCQEVASYLLFDVFTTRRDDIERSKLDDDVFEDIIICVKQDSVHVYCNGVNYWLLLPYVAHWPNLRLHCLAEEKLDNNDEAEEFKVQAFIQMVDGCKKLGVVYKATFDISNEKFDKMHVEKWPLVQAYALDDFAGSARGFFTLNHTVVDLSEAVRPILRQVDPVRLEQIYKKSVPQFEYLFENIMQTMDSRRNSPNEKWSAEKIAEPLTSYFQHGKISSTVKKVDFEPFVLLGVDTSKKSLSAVMAGKSVATAELSSPPTHMILQGSSAHGDLLCARTYFFDGTSHIDWDVNLRPADDERRDSVRLLASVHAALLDGIDAALATLAKGKPNLEAAATGKFIVEEALGKSYRGNVDFKIGFLPVDLKATDRPTLRYVFGAVYDITGPSGVKLGSVAHSDTILVSLINKRQGAVDGCHVTLTGNIPRYCFWTGLEFSSLHRGQADTCGQCVGVEAAEVMVHREDYRRFPVYAAFYERHILLHHRRLGSSVISFESVSFYDGSSDELGVLMVPCSYPDYVAQHLYDPETKEILIAIEPKSKAKRLLYANVFPMWRESQIFSTWSSLPPSLSQIKDMRSADTLPSPRAAGDLSGASVEVPLLEKRRQLRQFVDHLETGWCLEGRQCQWPIGQNLRQEGEEEEDEEGPELVLTVVCGGPASYKESLCTSLMRMVKEETRWLFLRPSSVSSLASLLATSLHGQRRPVPGHPKKRLRGLVCCPHLAGPRQVDKIVRELHRVRIGSVAVCIDHKNFFMDNSKLTFPVLTDFCAEGWVNNIVFTSMDRNSAQLEDVQTLLVAVNPTAGRLWVPKGEVARALEIDSLLDEEGFMEPRLVRSRILDTSRSNKLNDEELLTSCFPALKEFRVAFSRPLDRTKFTKLLKGLKEKLKGWPFTDNMYYIEGRVKFTNDESRTHEFCHCTLSGTSHVKPLETPNMPQPPGSLQPRPPGSNQSEVSSGFWVSVLGCLTGEDVVKDWLRLAAPKLPDPKPLVTREGLPKADLDRIHKERHFTALPEGWFYNGTYFVHMDGTKSDRHPEFETFVEEYIAAVNHRIEEYNAKLAKQPRFDLFDK